MVNNTERLDQIIFDLQQSARGYLFRQHIKKLLRDQLHIQYNELRKGLLPPNQLLLREGLLQNKLELINDSNYVKYLAFFCNLLIQSMQSVSISESFALFFLSKDYMGLSCGLIGRLLNVIFNLIPKCDVTKLTEYRHIATFTFAMNFFSAHPENCWPILKGNQEVGSIIKNLCTKILCPLATNKNIRVLMKVISDVFKGQKRQPTDETVDYIFLLTLRFLEVGSALEKEESYKVLVELLEYPAISIMLKETTFEQINKNEFFIDSIKCLTLQIQSSEFIIPTSDKTLNLLANLIYLGNKNKEILQNFLLNWAYLVNYLLEQCSKICNDRNKKNNCWHHPLLGWTSERIDASSLWIFPQLLKQISLLWSQEMIEYLSRNFFYHFDLTDVSITETHNSKRKNVFEKQHIDFFQKLFGKIIPKANQNTKGHYDRVKTIEAVQLPPVTLPTILCELYINALLAFNNSRIDILSNLSRDSSLMLIKLWHFISSDLNHGNGLRTYLGYLITDPTVNSPQFAPLHLFGDIAYSLISILDEKEMYESEKPFTREQLHQIARFANKFCYYSIWESLIDFEQKRPATLFASLYQLLGILYNRDCRRRFSSDPNFWIIPELNLKCLIAEFEHNDPTQRAFTLMDKMPHIIPLRDRIFLFRKFIAQEKELSNMPTNIITVERSRLIEDGYRQLGGLSGQALRGIIRVKFINQQGLDEAGIDQDGVFKEFLELTLKRVFTPELNLFKSTYDKLLYPSSTSNIHENHLELFNFVGRMLGKAVYEGICIDVQLAPVLLAAVLGKQLCPFDELASLDPLLYKNLTYVKHYTDSVDVEDLSLTFSFQEEFLGKIYTHELLAGGRELKVNNENKISYLHLMAHYRVVKQIREQTKSFVNGFRSIISEKWLSLFSTHELQFLISGQLSDIDLDDFKKHVQYYGGFHSNHRLIRWLWAILEEDFTAEERRLFLKFVTSCSRPPLLGFAYLEPSFSIRCIETSEDLDQGDTLGSVIRGFLAISKKKLPMNERLPTASTCFNLLKLPNYSRRSILLEKLRYAIHAETGFELS